MKMAWSNTRRRIQKGEKKENGNVDREIRSAMSGCIASRGKIWIDARVPGEWGDLVHGGHQGTRGTV